MRVYVRTDEGKVFWIPVPFSLIKLATSSFAEKMAYRFTPAESRKYLECVDFKELRHALNILKTYRGLEIVNVTAKDGTKVSIKL